MVTNEMVEAEEVQVAVQQQEIAVLVVSRWGGVQAAHCSARCRWLVRRHSMPMPSHGTCEPGKRRDAVRYAAIAWSLSSCAANAWPKPTHAGAKRWLSEVALEK